MNPEQMRLADVMNAMLSGLLNEPNPGPQSFSHRILRDNGQSTTGWPLNPDDILFQKQGAITASEGDWRTDPEMNPTVHLYNLLLNRVQGGQRKVPAFQPHTDRGQMLTPEVQRQRMNPNNDFI